MTPTASSIPVHCSHDALVDITELVPNPRNPNKHPDKQVALLAKIIRHQGWRAPIVVSKRSGFVVAGHGRLEAAKLLQVQVVPVNFQEFATEADEWAHVIADNRIAELAETDGAMLKDLLIELDSATQDFDMDLSGFDAGELERVINTYTDNAVDAEPQIDKAAELQKEWGTETGQLWQLGEHRLLCGDSTKREDVERLLDGAVPLLMVTDPPYGVNLDQSWRDAALGDKAMGQGNRHKVQNDDRADWTPVWSLFAGDIAYVWHASRFSDVVMASLRNAGLEPCQQLIWNKSVMVMGRSDYHFKHEPCWYAVRKGKPHLWAGDRKQTTVIEAKSPNHIMSGSTEDKTDHPTQKPIDCFMMIRNHNSPMVYDPFLGSGTTLIAAEGLGRKCYGLEISPAYVAVILQRFKDSTGKNPKLLPNV